jgi:hypothetical protein
MENLYVCVDKFNLCKADNVTIGKFYHAQLVNKESNIIKIIDDRGDVGIYPLYWFETGEEARKYLAKERLKDL